MLASQADPSVRMSLAEANRAEAPPHPATVLDFAQRVAECNAALLEAVAELREELAQVHDAVSSVKSEIADRRRKADWIKNEPIPYGHNNEPMLTTEKAAKLYGYRDKKNFIAAMRKRGIAPRRVNSRRFLWDRATIDAELNAAAHRAWGA